MFLGFGNWSFCGGVHINNITIVSICVHFRCMVYVAVFLGGDGFRRAGKFRTTHCVFLCVYNICTIVFSCKCVFISEFPGHTANRQGC